MNKMSDMWDSRYAEAEYAYGTAPNKFLQDTINKYVLTGRILFPAEGEGRNAVYAATQGMDVTAFDLSIEGKKKALKLADKKGVSMTYEIGQLPELELVTQKFDVAALIYAHFLPPILSVYHKKIASLIEVGGLVILEGFSKGHLPLREANPAVGGPGKLEMLFSVDSIQSDFLDFEIIQLEEVEVELEEGLYHNGVGKVIRFIGRKKG